MKKVLEVKNISKIYKMYQNNFDRLKEIFGKNSYHREFIANRDISFELYEGETLGIIGVNGAGKSTILKMIAGVITPTSGEIIRHGRVTALLELGTGFNPQMSGYDNIYLNGTLIGMSRDEVDSKIKHIIEFSELGDYINEPIKTYSSGMSMRLAFSIAIFSEPKILIVDEALSVGDAHFGAKCTRALRERKEKNMSIIYVSHDLNSLKLLCDRVILLNHGEVAKVGEPEDVINSYNFLISKLNNSKENMVIQKSNNSHGTYEAEIINVELFGEKSHSDIVSSGEYVYIIITIKSYVNIDKISSGIMIRDKFGQDIFGTNLAFNNIDFLMKKDTIYKLKYHLQLNIAPAKYSISSAIHYDIKGENRRLYWKDSIKNFEVAGVLGNRFAGISKLYPTITTASYHQNEILLVTTSKSVLLIDTATNRVKKIDEHRGLYYGITTDKEYIYIGARKRMLSSNIKMDNENGVILKFNKRLEHIDTLEAPFPLRDIHQIKFIDKQLYITCSYDNLIVIYDNNKWSKWFPLGEIGNDKNHFNSFYNDDKYIYILAHNFGDSEIYKFDLKNKTLVDKTQIGVCAHNIWQGIEKELYILSSKEGTLLNTKNSKVVKLEGFPRGITITDENIFIGISQLAERDCRDFVNGKILILDKSYNKLDQLILKDKGMVLDIKLINKYDKASNELIDIEFSPFV